MKWKTKHSIYKCNNTFLSQVEVIRLSMKKMGIVLELQTESYNREEKQVCACYFV